MFVHLHTRSWFSFRAGASSPKALVAEAARLGMSSMAITDRHGVYGVVRFQQACKEHGIQHVFGAEVPIQTPGAPAERDLVLIARNRNGYANLCQLLTLAHLNGAARELGIDLSSI